MPPKKKKTGGKAQPTKHAKETTGADEEDAVTKTKTPTKGRGATTEGRTAVRTPATDAEDATEKEDVVTNETPATETRGTRPTVEEGADEVNVATNTKTATRGRGARSTKSRTPEKARTEGRATDGTPAAVADDATNKEDIVRNENAGKAKRGTRTRRPSVAPTPDKATTTGMPTDPAAEGDPIDAEERTGTEGRGTGTPNEDDPKDGNDETTTTRPEWEEVTIESIEGVTNKEWQANEAIVLDKKCFYEHPQGKGYMCDHHVIQKTLNIHRKGD
jgi:hypothetical protein